MIDYLEGITSWESIGGYVVEKRGGGVPVLFISDLLHSPTLPLLKYDTEIAAGICFSYSLLICRYIYAISHNSNTTTPPQPSK
jgi:hypothetical protein